MVVDVVLAGLCRTDVYVARGLIERAADPLVLGHEFAGLVAEVGTAVSNVRPGDRVTVMPVIPCDRCEPCTAGQPERCAHYTMLGVDHDGAFAERVRVPASSVFRLPDSVSFMMGAYMEPIAACHAVAKAGLSRHGHGLIYGDNRISRLTAIVLGACGFEDVRAREDPDSVGEDEYDFVVETIADEASMAVLVRTVRPGGTIVIKSRQHRPVGIVFDDIVRKEIRLVGARYGPFEECISLAAEGRLRGVEALWGDVHPLDERFEAVFAAPDDRKQFFRLRAG